MDNTYREDLEQLGAPGDLESGGASGGVGAGVVSVPHAGGLAAGGTGSCGRVCGCWRQGRATGMARGVRFGLRLGRGSGRI